MEGKLAKNIFFSVICSLLLLGGVLGVVFGIIQRPDTTAFNSSYTESANAVVVSEIWNGSTFDKTNTQTLLNMLCNSSSGSISTLSSKIGSGTINATTLRGYSSGGNTSGKSIVVTLGGFKWIVTYLFKDRSGNTCATLWMADANGTGTYGNSSSYYGSSSQWTSGYPASMYGTSYVAVATLNNGGTYANITSNGTITSTSYYSSSSTHQYAVFTHSSGGIRPYIVQPNKVPYQTSSQGKTYNPTGYALMNESLGKVSTSDLYSSSYTYEALNGYTNWGNDYLWLPSISETGYSSSKTGLWQTSQAERANSTTYSWWRSGDSSYSRYVYSLNSSGGNYASNNVNTSYAIRPALHLNLTAVAKEMTKVSITLDKQSGLGGDDSVYAYPGDAMSTIDTPIRTGYTFGGYYSSTNGGGTQYYTATGASAATYPSSGGPTTLYAKWTAIPYTITYNANGGTLSNDTMTASYEQPFTLPSPEKAGYSAQWIGESIPTGTPISTPQELANIANDLTGSYYLTKDIDLSTFGAWTPIGDNPYTTAFSGVFDGRGYSIKNLDLTYKVHSMVSGGFSAGGLFGSINGAVVKNVKLENISGTTTLDTGYGAAVLVGYAMNSTITNCEIEGYVTIKVALSEPATGYESVGGVIGYADEDCTISYITNNATISPQNNTGVAVGIAAGGIAGNSDANIYNCVNNAEIDSIIEKDLTTGLKVGGICGNSTGTIQNCYNTGTIYFYVDSSIADEYYGGIAGYSTGNIINCFNAGSEQNKNIMHIAGGSPTLTNCYYLSSADATAQGTAVSSVATLASNFYNNLSDSEKVNWNYTAGSYPTLSHTVWSFEGAAGEVITFLGESDYTATAEYTVNTYTLALNGNGASNTVANQSVTFGTGKTITNSFTRVGYTFSGWATSASGSAAYSNGVNFDNLPVGANNNGATITLYAVWTANTYTVIYNANGGSGTMANSTHTYDVAKNLSKNTFTRDGYLFLGWSTSNSDKTPTYTDEQSVTNLATSGTVNLYAVWKANIIITLTSNNSDAGTVYGAGTYEKNAQVTLIAAGAVGYALLYWAELDANGDEVAQFVNNPLQITATESKTYKAYFGKAVEGIGVSATKGGVVYLVGDDFDSLEDNDTVTLCAKLVLEGYTFSHWEDINGNNLGTEMSVKLKKSVVMDNLITAVFVSATNNNVNNNTSN